MTVPKISDHHHLLQAPANQLSVLPKKSAEAPSRKRKSETLSSLVSELRESSAAGRVFSCPRFEIIFLLNGAARRGSPSDQNYERREWRFYRAEIRSASSGRRTIIFIFCWLLANHKVQKSHQNHRIVEPRKIFWRVAAAQALSSRCRFSTKATEYWGAWGADLLCRVADAEAELQNLDSAAVCWWRSSTRQHQVLDIRFKVIIVMC